MFNLSKTHPGTTQPPIEENPTQQCEECEGRGRTLTTRNLRSLESGHLRYETCTGCHGTGRVAIVRGSSPALLSGRMVAVNVLRGYYNNWVIVRADIPSLAWTGNSWAQHHNGIPTGDTQVCNFPSRNEAVRYITELWSSVAHQ
jgi:DnaJ-class molecular chaperone